MVRSFAPLGLDDVERAELTSLASRRSTLKRWRCGFGSYWPVLKASRARSWRPASVLIPTPLASDVGASLNIGLRVFGMSRARERPRMPGSRR